MPEAVLHERREYEKDTFFQHLDYTMIIKYQVLHYSDKLEVKNLKTTKVDKEKRR